MDQAELERPWRRHAFAEEQDLRGPRHADDARQPEGRPTHRAHGARYAYVAQLGVRRGDPEVAGERQVERCAERVTVERRDDGKPDAAQPGDEAVRAAPEVL